MPKFLDVVDNPTGMVVGPGVSVVGDIATWNDVTGTTLADSGVQISTDGTFAANSDTLVPTQKATKTYVDTAVGGAGDVSGPGLSVVGDLVTWNNITGTLVADSGVSISTDGTFAADSDTLVPTQKAVKTYVDTGLNLYLPLTGGTLSGDLTLAAGAFGTPSLMFTGAGATTGFYTNGANSVGLQAAGNSIWSTSGFSIGLNVPLIHFSSVFVYYQEPAGDYNQDANTSYVGMDTVGAARTVTLQAAPDSGHIIHIYDRNGNAAVNNITINGNGNNIDGAASITISINYGVVSMFFDGNNWKIV